MGVEGPRAATNFSYAPHGDDPRQPGVLDRRVERLGKRSVTGALLGADGCRFQAIGVKSLLCGPGDFGEAHQPNESISRRAFEEGVGVIRSIIERLCVE